MLYLAGASFKESEDGEYEIQSLPPYNPEFEGYKISSRSRSCTLCLQITTVKFEGRQTVLCDTPGFGDTEGIEFDIANSILMVKAIHRARSAKPVIVLNKCWQSDRFVSLIETLQSVIRLTGQKESLDFSIFRFVFTDCGKHDVKIILKKLHNLLQDIETPGHPHNSHLMITMVKAMIKDISSEFLYVDLKEHDAYQLQVFLLRYESNSMVMNPTKFFVPFVSEKSCLALTSQLTRSMIEVDNYFSDGLYRDALPLIHQLIQVCNVLQMVEHAVPKTISSQRMLQKLYECSRYHLSQVFSYTLDQKRFFLSELDKFKEINECGSLFCKNTSELSRYGNQVESYVALRLETEQRMNVRSNPTGWASKLVWLSKLSTVAKSFPFLGSISKQCNMAVDQIDDHLCQEIKTISALVQPLLVGLNYFHQTYLAINTFSTEVVEFSSTTPTNYRFQQKINDFSMNIIAHLTKVLEDFKGQNDKIKNTIAVQTCFTGTSHNIMHGGDLRSQFMSAIGTKECYKTMFHHFACKSDHPVIIIVSKMRSHLFLFVISLTLLFVMRSPHFVDVKIKDCYYYSQEVMEANVSKQDDFEVAYAVPVDVLSANQSNSHYSITWKGMMQVDDPYPTAHNASILDETDQLLSMDHQSDSSLGKSSEVDMSKLCDRIMKTVSTAQDINGKDIIQEYNFAQMAAGASPKTISSQKMPQTLFDCSHYHLSQFFHYKSDQKLFALSELDNLKEINERIGLFLENASEISSYTNQVESHLALHLESEQINYVTSNPTEWAWKLVRLSELALVANFFPFFDDLSRQCNKAVDRIDDHVCRELETVFKLVRPSLVGLADVSLNLINITVFSAKVVEFNSTAPTRYYFHERIDYMWKSIKTRLTQVSNDLKALSDTIENAVAAGKSADVTSHMIMHGGYLRNQLMSAIGAKDLLKLLYTDGWHFHWTLIAEFDEHLICWLSFSLNDMELEVTHYDTRNNNDMPFDALVETKSSIRERIQDLQKIGNKAKTWQDFEQIRIQSFLNRVIKMHTSFESYVKAIDEQHKRLVENRRKANTVASQFLHRLRSGNESISGLISELDEPNSWDSWNIFDEEKKYRGFIMSSYSRVRSVFGLNAENIKLKITLDDIIATLRIVILSRFESLLSIEFVESRSVETAKYILQQRNTDIRLLFALVRLRKESTLHIELIDNDINEVLLQCLKFLSDSFQKICQLPEQLVETHCFDKAAELLSVWKASNESWKHLRLFANLPLLQDFNGMATKLQERVRDCHEYESFVNIFFSEIKRIQSDVETISFDCTDVSLHEKNKFYGGLEQLLHVVSGFHKHKNHATSPDFERLLNIENIMLSQFSKELEKMGHDLMGKMDDFPNDYSCFKSINSLMSNLDSIDQIFNKTSRSISRQVSEIKSSMEQEIEIVFARMKENVDLDCTKCIFEFLIKWKRSGYEVQAWRSRLHVNIDVFLHEMWKERSANASPILLELSLLLRSVQGHDVVVANLLLSEHSIFEGSMNAIFDEKTAKQDIKYVLGELSSLSGVDKVKLEALYVEFESSYADILEQALRIQCLKKDMENDSTRSYFKLKAEDVMKDYDVKYSHQVTELTAVIFARWSIMSTSFFQKIATADKRRYLKKPHPAQVVAIWLMLNVMQDDYAVIKNVLVELKTGEWKSVVLGITATILALFGVHVDCACYSSFLSSRDYEDFKPIFESFGVLGQIRYGTIREFTSYIASGHYSNAESAINGYWPLAGSGNSSSSTNSSRSRIMLIDEVDVFFDGDVFGDSYRPALSISTKSVQNLFYSAWNSPDGNQNRKFVIYSYPKESRKLIETLVSDLINEARQVKTEESFDYFVVDNKVVKKYFDGLAEYDVSNKISFLYIKYGERGDIPKTISDDNLILSPRVGTISYAELPFEYTAIIGVTGTLRGLGESSQAILSNKYQVGKYFHVPSVFRMNRLMFSCESPRGKHV